MCVPVLGTRVDEVTSGSSLHRMVTLEPLFQGLSRWIFLVVECGDMVCGLEALPRRSGGTSLSGHVRWDRLSLGRKLLWTSGAQSRGVPGPRWRLVLGHTQHTLKRTWGSARAVTALTGVGPYVPSSDSS